MEGKPTPKSKRDSHKHSCVNFTHPCVNRITTKSNVQIEQLGANQIHANVEVLESPYGDGVWHSIYQCPPYVACSKFHVTKNHQAFLRYKDNYYFYWCPSPNLLRVVVSIP